METIKISKKMFESMCVSILDASLYWTGKDEENTPQLRTARTLAGSFLEDMRNEEGH
jgi:hypothetical protein